MLVASIRFRGAREEIPAAFDRLYAHARPVAAGLPFSLHYVHHPEEPPDIEVCLPVSQPVEAGGVHSRQLEGGELLCVSHSGPYAQLGTAWGQIAAYARAHHVMIDDEPAREVYIEDWTQHGDAAEHYVTELQVMLMLPRWLNRLAEGVDRAAGPVGRDRIMAGSEALTPDGPVEDKYLWARGAMQRLDETTRCAIMGGCAHRFPEAQIAPLRAIYQATGDIDAVLHAMESWPEWYESPWREGAAVMVRKIPYNVAGYEAASDPVEQRAQYCHCPTVKAAIRAGVTLPRSYCFCGAGWYARLWEGILGQPVRVELIDSVMLGGDGCRFAVRLPEGIM